jgi:hypothetical protein
MNNYVPSVSNEVETSPAPSIEGFGNVSINVDLILKSVFWAAIFYLLCLPDVHRMTTKVVGKKIDLNLIHAVVYALLYFIVSQFI